MKRFNILLTVVTLLFATSVDPIFAQRGRGGGGEGNRGSGGGGPGRSFSGGSNRNFSGGPNRSFSGGAGPRNRGGAVPNRAPTQGMTRSSLPDGRASSRVTNPGLRDGNAAVRGADRNVPGGRNYANREFGAAQGRTSFYRGNQNFNRANSAFFGNRGPFNSGYSGKATYRNYGNYGRGFGYGGYRGFGGYGLGYGGFTFVPFLAGLGLGYGLGNGWGYGNYGYGGYGTNYDNYPVTVYDNQQPPPPADAPIPPTGTGIDYVVQGEADFRAGNYEAAIADFRHALIDEPNNAGLMLLIAQALFQIGQWTPAAAATELAMGALPEEKWGTVVQNYTQLYGNIGDYTKQLKVLEEAVKQRPKDPALRFLLGYHYGYLNYPKHAERELMAAVELEGRDPAARRLHDLFAAKIGAPQVGPVPESPDTSGSAPNSTDATVPPAASPQPESQPE